MLFMSFKVNANSEKNGFLTEKKFRQIAKNCEKKVIIFSCFKHSFWATV